MKPIYFLLIGIIFPLPGMANPLLKKMKNCWYIKIPTVIEVKNCGNAICYGQVNCSDGSTIYSDIPVTCIARKIATPVPSIGKEPSTVFGQLGALYDYSNTKYKCPSSMDCSGITTPTSTVKKENLVRATLSRGYAYKDIDEVIDTEVLETLQKLPKGIFSATPVFPHDLYIPRPFPPPKPKETGGTQ